MEGYLTDIGDFLTEEERILIGDYILDRNLDGVDIQNAGVSILPEGIVILNFNLKRKNGAITKERIRVEEAWHILNGYKFHEKITSCKTKSPCFDDMSAEELLAEALKIFKVLIRKKDD